MKIGLAQLGEVKVDDYVHRLNVDASSEEVYRPRRRYTHELHQEDYSSQPAVSTQRYGGVHEENSQ